MSDCCIPGSSFPSASTMQQMSTNSPVVWAEICAIQQAILAAASQCQPGGSQLCTVVGGSTPMTFITGVQSVTVVDGGSGYVADQPAVSFIPPNGATPAVQATATLTTNGSNILSIDIVDGGSGYQPIPATLSISSLLGLGAVLEPLVNAAGQIVGVNVVSGGSSYSTSDSVIANRAVVAHPAYTDASIIITSVSVTGEILSLAVLNPGTGYQPSVTEVSIVSTLNPSMPYQLGTGFYGTVVTDSSGIITQVVINNTGAGYSEYLPYLVISDPGTGATTTVNLVGSSVDTITVNTTGSNYTTLATGTVFNPPLSALPNPPATPAIVTINTPVNTYGTDPLLYWNVWTGTETNAAIQMQINQVIAYFKSHGYTVVVQTNPASGTTLQWKLCW